MEDDGVPPSRGCNNLTIWIGNRALAVRTWTLTMPYHLTPLGRTALHRSKTAYPRLAGCESGFRFFSPGLGRWISRDPLEEMGGLDAYVFCANDSPDRADPAGLVEWTFDGPWQMFINYFSFAPEGGRLSDDVLSRLKTSWHMKDWRLTVEKALGTRFRCMGAAIENIRLPAPPHSAEVFDDVMPAAVSLFGLAYAGNWQVSLFADCKWRCGCADSQGRCECEGSCKMTVKMAKYYTFNVLPDGNPANKWIWVRWLNFYAWKRNLFQDPSFSVFGELEDEWMLHDAYGRQ